ANAVHLRFDVRASSLPEDVKQRLLRSADRRVGADGVVVIKAQQHRSLPRNRSEALQRLQAMVQAAAAVPRLRRATQPTVASQRRRLQGKAQRGKLKALRARPAAD
ncbi:MAG TPA: alternative ribosome rescue aminoacyl-tRNA hydrolase ArfB, partial [Rubrivivax sp.]|nr:alternative ribosome rescue aminoacyl-tRNA hydrolase ArfB [Rubrivivax sp.]